MQQKTMRKLQQHSYITALFVFFVAAVLCRPLLPIDETRYMTVAWEMFHTNNHFLLSLNYAPYHHKPPMLFWLINACWQIFGVSRWSALIPIFLASVATLVLSGKLAGKLYPDDSRIKTDVPWVLLGSAPFLIYGTIVMFDLLLAAVNLCFFLVALDFCEKPERKKTIFLGLLLGCGVLVKGPVVYLYTLLPLLFYPYWRNKSHTATPRQLYQTIAIALAASVIPVAFWLIPALLQADNNFAYWLVWEQTAGRVKGDFSASHARPFYFYLLLLPIMVLPWAFFPSFWKHLHRFKSGECAEKFLLCATLPVIFAFSVIAGKQPHYLLPILPFFAFAIGKILSESQSLDRIKATAVGFMSLFMLVQAVGAYTFLKDYDLAPIADFYNENSDRDFAFVRKYQGEIGFLARIEKPIESLEQKELRQWFQAHPEGLAIVRHSTEETFPGLEPVFSMPYRARKLTIYKRKSGDPAHEES